MSLSLSDRARRWTLVLGLAVASPSVALAQDSLPAAVIDSIIVEGNSRITAADIIAFSGLQLFQPVFFGNFQKAINNLYATGHFDDIAVEQRSEVPRIIAIVVKERPILQRWSLKGVEKIEESTIRKKIDVREGRAIDRAAVARTVGAIDSIYEKKGYHAAVVKVVETRQDSANIVDIVFDITEGSRVAISQVVVEGNTKFKDSDIVKGMSSRPEGFWWFRKGEFNDEKLDDDLRNRIPQWYADRGYVDLRILNDTLIADKTPGKAILKIEVDEGKRYQVGTFEVVGNRRFSTDELAIFFPFGEGIVPGTGKEVKVPFNQAAWDAATERLRDHYFNHGYVQLELVPDEVRRTTEDGTPIVDLRWRIAEGSPATINRIIVLGNDVTHERVIREQIVMIPGETFNKEKLVRSYQNISNLNFFEQPLPPPETNYAENRIDLDIVFRVVERHTGNVNFGATVGQGVGVGGFLGLEEPNLFGRGKKGTVQWQFGRNINDFNLSYFDPAIRDSRISGNLTLFNSRQRYTIGDLGRILRQGADLRLGFPLFGARYTRLFASYGYQRNRFVDTPEDLADRYQCEGSCSRSSVGLSVVRDTRIGLPFPVAGSNVSTSVQMNGGPLGGSGEYQKIDLEGKWYTPLGRAGGNAFGGGIEFTLGLTAKSGFVFGQVGPFFYELYSLGGVQYGVPLRGYDEFSITPNGYNPAASGSAVNPDAFGKAYGLFTLEAGARISQQLYVSLFSDAGNVYRRARQYNPTKLFRSIGVGAAIVSPLGPVGIDLGYGLDRVDETGRNKPGWQLHFRLGNFF